MISILFVLILLITVFVSTHYFSKFVLINRMRSRLVPILVDLEDKYEQVIKQRMTLLELEGKEFEEEQQKIEEEVLVIVQPKIESLISYLNSARVPSMKLGYRSVLFPNLVGVVEEMLYEKKNRHLLKTGVQKFGEEHEQKLIQALRSGMQADMAQLVLDWKTGTGQTYTA